MNKLLLLAFFSACLVAITLASEQAEEELAREARAAEPGQGDRAAARRAERKQSRNSAKDDRKAARMAERKKGLKKGNNKNKRKVVKKADKRADRKRERQAAKKEEKKAAKKAARKAEKKQVKNEKPEARSDTCMPEACITNAMSYLKLVKKKVANFNAQKTRVERFTSVSGKKSGKKGVFGPILNRIREAGGGNSSNLKCNGDATNAGAAKLANLTAELGACEASINASCNSGLPSINMTGADACTCWTSAELAAAKDAISGAGVCDISDDNKLMTAAKKACTTAFGACRKLEDTVSPALSACSPSNSVTKLTAAITQGTKNKAAAQGLKTKVASAASARAAGNYSCSAFITAVTAAIAQIEAAALSSGLETLLTDLSSSTVAACSTDEKTALTATSTLIDAAVTVIEEYITEKQSALEIQTGSTIAVSTVATGTTMTMTTMAASRRLLDAKKILKANL